MLTIEGLCLHVKLALIMTAPPKVSHVLLRNTTSSRVIELSEARTAPPPAGIIQAIV